MHRAETHTAQSSREARLTPHTAYQITSTLQLAQRIIPSRSHLTVRASVDRHGDFAQNAHIIDRSSRSSSALSSHHPYAINQQHPQSQDGVQWRERNGTPSAAWMRSNTHSNISQGPHGNRGISRSSHRSLAAITPPR